MEPVPITVMDGLGQEKLQEVTVDVLKNRFFVLGLQTGMAMQMFVVSTIMMMVCYGHDSKTSGAILLFSHEYYPLFRALFLICFFGVFHGVCLYIWKRCGINYRVLLGVPHSHNYHSVIRGFFTVITVVFSTFALYVLTLTVELTSDRHVWPASAAILSLVYLFSPWDWMPSWYDRFQRYSLLVTIGYVLVTPMYRTTFARTFVADILTSMPKVFLDVHFTSCVYAYGNVFQNTSLWAEIVPDACTSSNPTYNTIRFVLSVFPFWIRLLQCLRAFVETRKIRHNANALKYCTSIAVVVLSNLAPESAAWVTMSVLSTVCAFCWDVLMDWGHGPAALRAQLHGERFGSPSDAPFLRPFRLYPTWCYYAAFGTNAIARMGWAILISPNQAVVQQHFILLIGCIEMLRRAQWAIFRLEWEQIHLIGNSSAAESMLALRARHAAQSGVSKAEAAHGALAAAVQSSVIENKFMSATRYVLLEQ
ncbi:hypothetical protein AB1Y20_020258 [Prymnesium parvum]|uniref:EXS domain-containing protein n=1 Tax=Prymnesium parvum TaxID=97485 RepID=A0AB34JYS2_PRYPA